MLFKLLGLLEVSSDGNAVAIGPGKESALLAILLLNANEPVPIDRLAGELWPDRPPDGRAKAIQVYVSRLRKQVGADRLLTTPGGYLLKTDHGELDIDSFQRLALDGRGALERGLPDRAKHLLTEALALWRGPPLAEFRFETFAQDPIRRFEEQREAAVSDRLEARLALGEAEQLLPELEGLVRESPLREQLRAQLMLCLYRCGRQAEALAVYHETRELLVKELGIEPSPRLRELQQAILRQDPGLEPPTRAPAAERASGLLVGRERELAELSAGLERAFSGHGGVFLLAGEPGIGKSRLADELVTRARSRGAAVLVGRCWEAGGAPAYWPWVQALRAHVETAEPAALREQLGASAMEVAELIPELKVVLPDLPDPPVPVIDPEEARFRLFDAVAAFLRRIAGEQPVVIALDDLHAADEPSLLLLRFLASTIESTSLLVLAAYRNLDPTIGEPLSGAVGALARERATTIIDLKGLPEHDVAKLIELTGGEAASPELVTSLHEETEGNPFFVGEIVRLLSSEGGLGGARGPQLPLPETLKEVVGRRLQHLSDACVDTLRTASVLGREFDLVVLSSLTGIDRTTLIELLDEAVGRRVVSGVPGTINRMRFAHALIRDVLYESLPPGGRATLHRRAVEVLEELSDGGVESRLAELAHHSFLAVPAGGADKAIAYAMRAGELAVKLLAYEEAERQYRAALSVFDQAPGAEPAARCEILLALADSQERAGDDAQAKDAFEAAAAVARSASLPDHLARAALGYGGRDVWGARAEWDARLVALLEDALAATGDADSALCARLLARLATALRGAADRGQPLSLAGRAVEMAERVGDRPALVYALEARAAVTHASGSPSEAISRAREVVELAEELGDQERAFGAHEQLLWSAWTLGDPVVVRAEVDALERIADELRIGWHRWLVSAFHAMSAIEQGRFADAGDLVEVAFHAGRRSHNWNALMSHTLHLFLLRAHQGRLEECEGILEETREAYPGYSIIGCALASLYAQLGRLDDARQLFEPFAADDFAGLPREEDWLANICLLTDVCLELDDPGIASAAYRLLEPYGHLNAVASAELGLGAVARPLALLATAMGAYDEAETHFEAALDMNGRMNARPWLALTQEGYGRMLLSRGRPQDAAEAQRRLQEAAGAYLELGMPLDSRRERL
jgi:DNA-binding SARP family transcriptional activator